MPESVEIADTQVNNLSSLVASSPEEMIANATKYATALGKVIKDRKLYTPISGKNHVNIEGWSTLGTLLGVLPFIEWSRRCEGDREGDLAFEARAILKSMSGQIVGSGEAMAARSEGASWGKNMYSIRSMAETRATGKAFRLSFAWIMKLAGYDALPLEEIVTEQKPKVVIQTNTEHTTEKLTNKLDGLDDNKASTAQVRKIFALIKQVGLPANDGKEYAKNRFNLSSLNDMTKDQASQLIDELERDETHQGAPWESVKAGTLDDKIKGSKFNPENAPKTDQTPLIEGEANAS